jgi:protein-S-isoprenylcysteine O-methyltransferase Ste14
MLMLGVVVHLFVPGLFLVAAWRLDARLGWGLRWPLWMRLPLGFVVLIVSAALEGASLPQFFRHGGIPAPFQPTESLVVTGPYRYCRNPIYMAYVGYLLGPGILLGLQSIFPLAGIWWLALAAQARFIEERALRRRFGAQFEAYRQTTPFMIPRFWRRR